MSCVTQPRCGCYTRGVDTTVVALWLGHEQVETTQMYIRADLALIERASARSKPLDSEPGRWVQPEALRGVPGVPCSKY
jgi:integrase